VRGTPPSLIDLPPGCSFNPRCPYCALTDGLALTEAPALRPTDPGIDGEPHAVACHLSPARRKSIWSQEVAPKL
jgi:peptide/nickel transport system ATP-binding protein